VGDSLDPDDLTLFVEDRVLVDLEPALAAMLVPGDDQERG
jgi:hypothetical protein